MSNQFNEIDALIRAGQTAKAATLVTQYAQNPLSRPESLELARLARRAFIPAVGISLLRPFVRPGAKEPVRALPAESLEYAACLTWIGALPEAFVLLQSLDHRTLPDVDLIQSLALFAEWRYADAIPLLERYSQNNEVSDYWRLVAKVNLLGALVHERQFTKVTALVSELEAATRAQNRLLLLSNVLQMRAENAINEKNWDLASQYIDEALRFTESQGRADTLFAQKWRAVLALYRDPSTQSLALLGQVRAQALALQHWETLRDCDFHQVHALQDARLGVRLYFGTPFKSYREKLLQENPWLEIPDQYAWENGAGGPELVLEKNLKEGQVLHRLLGALCSDFYKPQNLGDLHSKVFPWKLYHPSRSADSLHQALRRLREYFVQNKFPIKIMERQGNYSLQASAPVTVLLRPKAAVPKRLAGILVLLKEKFMARRFSALMAAEVLGLSRNMALVHLRELEKLGCAKKYPAGPRTEYLLS